MCSTLCYTLAQSMGVGGGVEVVGDVGDVVAVCRLSVTAIPALLAEGRRSIRDTSSLLVPAG
jgi:hypothetical protein